MMRFTTFSITGSLYSVDFLRPVTAKISSDTSLPTLFIISSSNFLPFNLFSIQFPF